MDNPGIVQDVKVLSKIRCSDDKMVWRKVRQNRKKERRKLTKGKKSSIKAVRKDAGV